MNLEKYLLLDGKGNLKVDLLGLCKALGKKPTQRNLKLLADQIVRKVRTHSPEVKVKEVHEAQLFPGTFADDSSKIFGAPQN